MKSTITCNVFDEDEPVEFTEVKKNIFLKTKSIPKGVYFWRWIETCSSGFSSYNRRFGFASAVFHQKNDEFCDMIFGKCHNPDVPLEYMCWKKMWVYVAVDGQMLKLNSRQLCLFCDIE